MSKDTQTEIKRLSILLYESSVNNMWFDVRDQAANIIKLIDENGV